MFLPLLLFAADYHSWSSKPIMGWNSWDCFGTTVTEAQTLEQAEVMARRLKTFGWKLVTVDIQWYEPNSKGYDYRPGAELTMDDYGRLLPAPNKFPSGFTDLASKVHGKGLLFGIHMMRGIPRQAVEANVPILGTSVHARDIADRTSTCPWNPDMYGVDMSKPGAQAYYDSVFAQAAKWGIDFVKVDDLSRPYHQAEIEAIRKAIDKTGRKIVFSTSPGETPLSAGPHVQDHANMWRISDDFWDSWPALWEQFKRLNDWTPYRKPGAFPDADMLPLGVVQLGRKTNFTPDESRTLMTLWSIARSPLIFGGDLTKLDDPTLALITNPEVLKVNQESAANRQLRRENELIVWVADVPNSRDKYVALFNAQDNSHPYDVQRALFRSGILRGNTGPKGTSIRVKLGGAKKLALSVTDGGDGFAFDHVAWVGPKLVGPKGELALSELKWNSASAGWHHVRMNQATDGGPLTVDGKTVLGIGTHANSLIEYDIPEGYDEFQCEATLHDRCEGKGSVEIAVLTETAKTYLPDHSDVSVSLKDLGITSKAKVRDLWSRRDIGEYEGRFSQSLPLHGAGLFRISPK